MKIQQGVACYPSQEFRVNIRYPPVLSCDTVITSSRCTLHVYLNRFMSELDCSPAETLENHHFSAEIAILKYDTVCSYACSAQKFSSAVGKPYIDGILSSSAFQRGAVHVVQIEFDHQSHPPCAVCRFWGRKLPPGAAFYPRTDRGTSRRPG